jgi:hypothetical protein
MDMKNSFECIGNCPWTFVKQPQSRSKDFARLFSATIDGDQITIPANATRQNSWFLAMVRKKWDNCRSKVLDHDKGKT